MLSNLAQEQHASTAAAKLAARNIPSSVTCPDGPTSVALHLGCQPKLSGRGFLQLEHLLGILSWEVDRQPAYFEEDPRLRHQQNLPSSPARLKIAVSLRRLGERIRMFQPQLQRPLRNPLQYLTGTNL